MCVMKCTKQVFGHIMLAKEYSRIQVLKNTKEYSRIQVFKNTKEYSRLQKNIQAFNMTENTLEVHVFWGRKVPSHCN